jgi:hypothetical protein
MLPSSKTPPKSNLSDLTVLVYGNTKIGKSTLGSQAENALFLATEAGLNHLEVFQVPITSWADFLTASAEVAEGKHPFKQIIVDTVDNAYRFCSEYWCKKLGIVHEADAAYGKAFALVNGEFHRVLTRLSMLPYGLWLISHAEEREVETRTGKVTRVGPTLPGKARKIVLGLVDVVLYCDTEVTPGAGGKPTVRRVMRTKPGANYEAGDRTGRLPEVIDLDYAKFVEAFNRSVSVPATNK